MPFLSPSASQTEDEPSLPKTHQRLLEVAAELFAERGYLGASMKDIASRVGVRKPSLYNYYSSKDELFLDLLDRSLKAWSEAGRAELLKKGSLEERLHRHLKTAVEFAGSQPHAVAICRLAVSQISGELAERVGKRLEAERVDYQGELKRLMEEAVQSGEIAPPIETKALAWSAFFDGILFNLVFEHLGSDAFRDHLDGLWQVFWQGLAVREETR